MLGSSCISQSFFQTLLNDKAFVSRNAYGSLASYSGGGG